MAEYSVIDTRDAFDAALALIAAGTGPVAVDVERASGFRYSQRAYLIQVFRQDAGVFLFDPPALGDMGPLQEVIGGEEWILHAASQDLPSLREEGLEPASIFDTELAGRLLGWERVGLGAVVERTLGITLKKEHSAADWSTRPLPDSWLEYAGLDVVYLVDVADIVRAELEETGKADIARQEFDDVQHKPAKPPREDPWAEAERPAHASRGANPRHRARSLDGARRVRPARGHLARSTGPGSLPGRRDQSESVE